MTGNKVVREVETFVCRGAGDSPTASPGDMDALRTRRITDDIGPIRPSSGTADANPSDGDADWCPLVRTKPGRAGVGAWLQQRDDVDARVLAEHCERSGELDRAVHFYMLAAEESWDNNDADAAGPCAERGLQLGASGETRGTLLSVLAGVRSRQERYDECEAQCTEALALLPPGSRRWVRTFHVLFPVVVRTCPARLGELLHRFFDVEPEPGTRANQIHAVTWISAILAITGVLDLARTLLAGMRRTFGAIDCPDALALHGRTLLADGRPAEALVVLDDAMARLETLGMAGYGDLELCLVTAEVRRASGCSEAAMDALKRALQRLRARVDGLPADHRRAYLTRVQPHARLLAFARGWLGADALALAGLDVPAN